MLYNGIREHGYTIDIDSLTVEFDEEVKNLIKQILLLENQYLLYNHALLRCV